MDGRTKMLSFLLIFTSSDCFRFGSSNERHAATKITSPLTRSSAPVTTKAISRKWRPLEPRRAVCNNNIILIYPSTKTHSVICSPHTSRNRGIRTITAYLLYRCRFIAILASLGPISRAVVGGGGVPSPQATVSHLWVGKHS